ncbi:MAG: SIR2 family NAD-dependent protein deacylase [bacterium]
MPTHDPLNYIRGLQQLLVSDKKRIGFLFGAGSSLAKKYENDKNSLSIPAIKELTETIVGEMVEYQDCFSTLKEELSDKFNIETILTALEQKLHVIGEGTLNGLNKEEFKELIKKYKKNIRKVMSVHKEFDPKNSGCLIQTDFAQWIRSTSRKYPIEIFTTNYDYLIELGLEYNKVPYYDGFSGSFNPFFNSDSIEDMKFLPNQTKLWKIHGSLGWKYNEALKRVVRGVISEDENDLLIYPSVLKYNESKKQPYESLMDRLSNFLKTDDSLLIICGYSFGDEHINARIESALNANSTSHVIALFYDKGLEEEQVKNLDAYKIAESNSRISIYGFRFAVIGTKFGKWQLKSQPNKEDIQIDLYFDQDFKFRDIELKKEEKGTELWTGEVDFKLPDFVNFVNFLSKQIPEMNY